MEKGYYPIQNTITFPDLSPEESVCNISAIRRMVSEREAKMVVEEILGHKDSFLLFMTLTVSMTSENEMPIVRAYTGHIPQDIRGINRAASKRLYNLAPHFFLDDSRILQYWNKPFETEEILSNFKCSVGIDFSMTNEMTRPQKIYASFRNKLWVAWLQSRGHEVIPNVSFPDEWMADYWLEGWPMHSVIAISSVGVMRHGDSNGWLKAVRRIRKELQPTHILRYGPRIYGENSENCTYFDNDNFRSANGR